MESLNISQKTAMQLLVVSIIRFEIDAVNNRIFPHCKLCFDKRGNNVSTCVQTHYEMVECWKYAIEV